MATRTEKMKALIDAHGVSLSQVAEILGRSYTQVRIWASRSPQEIPQHSLELLEYKLKEMHK